MGKGYWIASVNVTDPQKYAEYQALASEVLSGFGAQFLVRGGEVARLEGRGAPERSVIMEFPSYEQALACYHSTGYQQAKLARERAAEVEVMILEGI